METNVILSNDEGSSTLRADFLIDATPERLASVLEKRYSGVSRKHCLSSELPAHFVKYQVAYALDFHAEGLAFSLDLEKAKEVRREEFRRARVPLMQSLDVQFMRAVELDDAETRAEIAAQKQALRDVTSIPLPDSLEGIESAWPEILGPQP